MRLGRDDDACEVARIMVAAEAKLEWKSVLVDAHRILGEVAAKRGDLDEADGHYANALKEATLSRIPMLRVLVARDWKARLLEPNGRDCSATEAAIDGACAEMGARGRTRGELASVLRMPPRGDC